MPAPTHPKPEDRTDYISSAGFARWWPKDGGWHIALPCPDPDPETGYSTGGYRYTGQRFNTRQDAIAALAPATPEQPTKE